MKNEVKIIGVYLWTNIITDEKYVGVSINILKRWKQHEQKSKEDIKRKFYIAIKKYGTNNFKKEIIEQYDFFDKKILKKREDYYIDFYDSIKNGYNTEKGYNTITDNPNIENIKNKISTKAKDRKWINNGIEQLTCSSELIEGYIINGWVYGRLKFSNNHIESLRLSHIGHIPTKETREKLSLLWLGRNHSEETKKMMSTNLQGRYSLSWYINKYGIEDGNKKYLSHRFKINKKNKGKICVNNNVINKMIIKEELESYIKNNWVKGRLKK